MIYRIACGVLLSFLFLDSVDADILPSEDIDLIDVNSDKKECGLEPYLAVDLAMGRMHLPYGPPGFTHYSGTSRSSGISLGLKRYACESERGLELGGMISVVNHFPANYRQYDVQAVSWTDLKLSLTASLFPSFVTTADIDNRIWIGTAGWYERFHYARGIFSFQSIPLTTGLESSFNFQSGLPKRLGVSFEISQVLVSKVLLKYNPAYTSTRANSPLVAINPEQFVSGRDFDIAGRFGFSQILNSNQTDMSQCCQHEISLHWNQKTRESKTFMEEYRTAPVERKQMELDLETNTWTLRWTEKI